MGAKPEGVCHQCGERLSLVKRMKNETFCSPKCKNEFFGFDEGLALERLKPLSSLGGAPRKLVRQPAGEAASGESAAFADEAPLPAVSSESAVPAPAVEEEILPPSAGFLTEVTARAVAVPNAFSEGAFGELPPSLGLVQRRVANSLRTEWTEGSVPSCATFVPWQDGEITGQDAAMLQVLAQPVTTLGDPRLPVCGIGVVEFDWAGTEEMLSTPPEANWVDWTWEGLDCDSVIAGGEADPYEASIRMQLPLWLQPGPVKPPSAGEYVAWGSKPVNAPAPAGIWPSDEGEINWQRAPFPVKPAGPASEPAEARDRNPQFRQPELPAGEWLEFEGDALDDGKTAARRLGDAMECGIEMERPVLPASSLDGELPGRPRVLPDEPAEMLLPFIIVDNTSTLPVCDWKCGESDAAGGFVAPPVPGVSLGQPDQWSRHLALAPVGMVAATPAAIELDFRWPEAKAMAAPLVCAFESRETWDVI